MDNRRDDDEVLAALELLFAQMKTQKAQIKKLWDESFGDDDDWSPSGERGYDEEL